MGLNPPAASASGPPGGGEGRTAAGVSRCERRLGGPAAQRGALGRKRRSCRRRPDGRAGAIAKNEFGRVA